MSEVWIHIILFVLGVLAGTVVTATIFMVDADGDDEDEDNK